MIAIILYYYTYLIIYREKTKQEEGKEEREPRRRMPPPSSPVPRLSSVPSAASTVHTIASRSPLRPIVPALSERDGRPPRPLLGDAIATTSPSTNNQQQGSASTFCHHARRVLVLFLHVVR